MIQGHDRWLKRKDRYILKIQPLDHMFADLKRKNKVLAIHESQFFILLQQQHVHPSMIKPSAQSTPQLGL